MALPPLIFQDALGYPRSWSASEANTLRGSNGAVVNLAGALVTSWLSQETGATDGRHLVSMGSAGGATLVQESDGVFGLQPGSHASGRPCVRSPINHIFCGSPGSSYFMNDRVFSVVYTWYSGVFLFSASRRLQGDTYAQLVQVNIAGQGQAFGVGGYLGRWDKVLSYSSNTGNGARQVLSFAHGVHVEVDPCRHSDLRLSEDADPT